MIILFVYVFVFQLSFSRGYDTFCSKGRWTGKGDPLEDPWMDPSTVELTLQMHQSAEKQLRLEELRQTLLSSQLETIGGEELFKELVEDAKASRG